MLRTAFAFLAAPVVGSVAGGLAMSAAVPGPAAMFSVMYVVFGGSIAFAATLFVGIPTVAVLRHKVRSFLPWLVAVALTTSICIAVALQCVLARCSFGPLHNVVFAAVSA